MSIRIDKGAVAEYRFASELLDRGIVPNWPSTEGRPYDILADTGSGCIRIQVKGSVRVGPVVNFQFMLRQRKKKRRYSKDEVDFIVLYLFEFGIWYIFPIDDVETAVRLRPNDPKCKYSIYKQAWHLLPGLHNG